MKEALKLLEQARKQALASDDVEALRQVLEAARRVHGHADQKQRNKAVGVMNAAQQNIRFLTRKQAVAAGQEWVDPFSTVRTDTAAVEQGPRFPFGDPARPQSLALGLIASIGCFPLLWVLFFSPWAVSGDAQNKFSPETDHVVIFVAAAFTVAGMLIATGAWIIARRSTPATNRKPLAGREGVIGAAGVIAAVACAAILGYFLWKVHQ